MLPSLSVLSVPSRVTEVCSSTTAGAEALATGGSFVVPPLPSLLLLLLLPPPPHPIIERMKTDRATMINQETKLFDLLLKHNFIIASFAKLKFLLLP
jgi:hypothetical protein